MWAYSIYAVQKNTDWSNKRVVRLGSLWEITLDDPENSKVIARQLSLDVMVSFNREEFLKFKLVEELPVATSVHPTNVDRAKAIAKSSLHIIDKQMALYKILSQSSDEEKIEINKYLQDLK